MVEVILRSLHGKYVFTGLGADFAAARIERFFREEDADEHQLAVWSFDLLSALKRTEKVLQVPELLQKVLQFKTTAQPSLKPLYPQKHFFNRRRYLNDFLTPTDISGWISQKFSAKLRLMSS